VGAFVRNPAKPRVLSDSRAEPKKVKVLFLGIGSAEGQGTKTFSDALTKAGIDNVYFESPGHGP